MKYDDDDDDDVGGRYREGIFVGRSQRTEERGPMLEEAVEDAYNKAQDAGRPPPYRVLEIWVDGENPLSEYIVALKTGS
jgi:hypothetical protein